MKTTTKLGALLLTSTLLFSACQRSGGCGCEVEDPYAKGKGDLKVFSNITKPSTRVAGESWEVSDAIGIFAIEAGKTLGSTNHASNAKYTTASAGERVAFTSLNEGITLPSSGNLDLIAYYPYGQGVTTEVSFDTSDQSKPGLIDLLYSNNQKGVSKSNPKASLVFNHMLTLVVFDITTDGQAISNGTITLKDVVVDGKMSLADGAIQAGNKSASLVVTIKSAGANKYKGTMILPPQLLTDKEVAFNIDGKEHLAKLKLAQTESGYKYTVEVTYTKGQLIIVEGATINPWKEGGNNGETIVIGAEEGGSTPTPTPPTPTPVTGKLLFPGGDFEDWTAFTGSLNKYGLIKDISMQVDGGRTGKALLIKGTPTKNDYVFTTTAQAGGPTSGKTITFYINGTAGKSISLNVYDNTGKYKAFNLGEVSSSSDINLDSAGNNQYGGAIDTQGAWVKVTLNIEGINLATANNFFALKVGKEVAYDLLIDDFTIE